MFVVSYLGLLHGPFKTAEAASDWGGAQDGPSPWTIIPVKDPEPRDIIMETIGSHAPPQRFKGRSA